MKEEYMAWAKKQAEKDPMDYGFEIMNRLVNRGERKSDCVIWADFEGNYEGAFWKYHYNVHPTVNTPPGEKELWEEYIYYHKPVLISGLELKGTYQEYALIMSMWTYIYNNHDKTIEEVCEWYSNKSKFGPRALKNRLKKVAQFRLENFGW